jgi:hypothetical protein
MSSKKIKTDYAKIKPLRDAIYEYSRSWEKDSGAYSVTEIIKPPRIVMLERRYASFLDQLPMDHDFIEKLLGSFRGSALHSHFEYMLRRFVNKHPDSKYVIERRLFDKINGRKISGKPDLWLDKIVYDWKTTSVWKKIFNDWEDFIQQLNIYCYLFRESGRQVDYLRLIVWYQDWEKFKIYEKGYPKTQIEEIPITDKWTLADQLDFIKQRIQLMKENETVEDAALRACTDKEMWTRDEMWKVYKVKRVHPDSLPKKSSRNLPTKKDAIKWIHDNMKQLKKDEKWKTVHVPGRRQRCEEFCRVNMFCNIYHEYMEGRDVE